MPQHALNFMAKKENTLLLLGYSTKIKAGSWKYMEYTSSEFQYTMVLPGETQY